MPDYHPIDVRYKGPSTAYRGSTRTQANARGAPAKRSTHHHRSQAEQRPASTPSKPRVSVVETVWRALKWTFRFVHRANVGIILALILIGAVTQPDIIWEWLNSDTGLRSSNP